MIILESKRLRLIPLTLKDLEDCLIDKIKMERSLGVTSDEGELSGLMESVFRIKINNIKNDEKNYLFYTYWIIVLRENNRLIGKVGFKNIPDKNGEVEVGYGIDEGYRCCGYMTEALNRLLAWAFEQNTAPVLAVTACTEKSNLPSQRVLTKAGMRVCREDDKFLFWKLEKAR